MAQGKISAKQQEILDYIKEYNTDTSAGHPLSKDDDIVRYSLETKRIQDKEPICNK